MNPGRGLKTEKRKFPALGGPKLKKNVTRLSGMVVRNFLIVYVLTDLTPRGGKSRNTGVLGLFGLGRPLETTENRKTQTAIWRPKREKQPPSSVPIPVLIRVRVSPRVFNPYQTEKGGHSLAQRKTFLFWQHSTPCAQGTT